MKRFLIFFTILISIGFGNHIHAQSGQDQIRKAMVSLYTERMDLTDAQANKFWPIHTQYENERRKINKEIRTIKGGGNPNDLKKLDQLEEQRFELRTKYKSRFLEIINANQLSKMYSAEEEFRKMLIDRKNRD